MNVRTLCSSEPPLSGTDASAPDPQAMVRAFHLAMGLDAPIAPIELDSYPGDLRSALIVEEVEELAEAFRQMDLIRAIDAVCDILYVAYGAAVAMGECLERDLPWRDVAGVREASFRSADLQRVSQQGEEFTVAWANRDRAGMLLALTCLVDAIYATAAHLGVDVAPFFAEVHNTNMAKRGGPLRHDGKIGKPEGWQPPDIAGLYGALYGGQRDVGDLGGA